MSRFTFALAIALASIATPALADPVEPPHCNPLTTVGCSYGTGGTPPPADPGPTVPGGYPSSPWVDPSTVHVPSNPGNVTADPVSRPEGLLLPTGVIFPDKPECNWLPMFRRFFCIVG